MICAIHQPQFMPWLGYLHKICRADKFVFLDDVQFKKNEFQNRNRVLIAGEPRWLTVPVSFHFGDTLRETMIANNIPWRKKMMHAVELNYAAAPFFNTYREGFAEVIGREWENLAELNAASARWLMECFGIRTETFISSQLPLTSTTKATTKNHWIPDQVGNDILSPHSVIPVTRLRRSASPRRETGIQNMRDFEITRNDPRADSSGAVTGHTTTQRLIDICRLVGADTYLSGAGGHKYLEQEEFEKAGIRLVFQDFRHPVYPQRSTGTGAAFTSNLSALDGLFNCGGGEAGRKTLNIER